MLIENYYIRVEEGVTHVKMSLDERIKRIEKDIADPIHSPSLESFRIMATELLFHLAFVGKGHILIDGFSYRFIQKSYKMVLRDALYEIIEEYKKDVEN